MKKKPGLAEGLGKLLDEAGMQVTVTGWKAELIRAEKENQLLEAKVSGLEHALLGYQNLCEFLISEKKRIEKYQFERRRALEDIRDASRVPEDKCGHQKIARMALEIELKEISNGN